MTITDPPVTPGDFRYRQLSGRRGMVHVDDVPVCVLKRRLFQSRIETHANCRLLASSKKMANALKAVLMASAKISDAVRAWDDADEKTGQDRVAEATIDRVLAEEEVRKALEEAGFTFS